jgi:RNA polymerase sigma-70 factor (ECF subfamily)
VDSRPWSCAVSELQGSSAAEAALLQAGLAGDREALDQLLALHERRLLALCHGMLGHAEDAEDAVQETFFRALRALPRFRRDASFRTWLLRIAVNLCLNWKRDHRPTEPWNEGHLDGSFQSASPEVIALVRLQMVEALGVLPPQRRAALLLREMDGWSVAEIGAAMGWNLKRVYNELYKARHALADWQARHVAEETEP